MLRAFDLLTAYDSYVSTSMAFHFGFGGDDDDDDQVGNAKANAADLSQTHEETHPVTEHDLKDLVGMECLTISLKMSITIAFDRFC